MVVPTAELSAASKEFLEGLPTRSEAFEAREYQVEVAKSIVERGNSLVVMPTALGKTFVAALVIAKLMRKFPEGRFLFLVPTRPLATQQANRMKELLRVDDEDVTVITGEVPIEERGKLWGMRIICATPQVTKNDVKRGLASLDFKLIVFDEVHRLVKDYAYTWIARRAPREAQFLGLTASPSADREKIREICDNLRVQNIEARSEKDLDVAPYVKEIEVEWQFVELPQELKEIKASLEDLLIECMKDLKRLGWIAAEEITPTVLRRIGKSELLKMREAASRMARTDVTMFRVLTVVARAMNLIHAQDLLESEGVNSLKAFIENTQAKEDKTRAVRALLKDPRFLKILERCRELSEKKFEHPKMTRLREIVSGEVPQGKSTIVFAHYRSAVAYLVDELNGIPGVVAKQLVGKAGDGGMSQKEQVALIQEFREKEFNVMVASSIGEEGLDIPAVDLVVFYEAVPSEIRAIQRRGRTGRVRSGKVIALITKGGRDEAYWWISRRKEKAMHRQVERLKERLDEGSQMKVVDYPAEEE